MPDPALPVHLFHLPDPAAEALARAPSVVTPLGEICFRAAIGEPLPDEPDDVRCAGDDVHVFGWSRADCRAELLICRPRIHLPPGLSVTDCWAGMWRVRATAATGPLSFTCGWAPEVMCGDGGPETGQYLEAQTWTDGATRVTVGTADGEMLFARAQQGLLPSRWTSPDVWGGRRPDELAVGRYSLDALAVDLPGLTQGEGCQLHFAVAWASESADVSTWFAVDCSPEQVLAGLSAANSPPSRRER